MLPIPAGEFWVGTHNATYDHEENPRFRTRVAAFCADETEVTTAAYEGCVKGGACRATDTKNKTCNSSQKGRGDHPINCLDFDQAVAVCAARGARLPDEVEWEYLARGGAEMRNFSWGKESPDGRACWKHHQSCAVKTYAPGAFGLYDVAGNVWEWTESWFSPHPWPAVTGQRRVVKGGGWSRRFDKWLVPTLRNREKPSQTGSHLGVRCVLTLPDVRCPSGQPDNGRCPRQIEEVDCLDGRRWNGARCASERDAERCAPGTHEEPGRGCVREIVAVSAETALDLAAVTRAPSPEFDADCQANQPTRPHAYRYSGGEHLARNDVGSAAGCKNRDVGVGWNSACCP